MPENKRLNLLFSTTRQWNIGDEFISFGTKNIIKAAGIDFNSIIYNRNPQVCPLRWTDHFSWAGIKRPQENSLMKSIPGLVDAAVIAGSPEWRGGRRAGPLLDMIIRQNLPTAFVGIGSASPFSLKGPILEVMRKQSRLVICRDQQTHESISRYIKAHLLPCPSIYAFGNHNAPPPTPSITRIAIIIQDSETQWQRVPKATSEWLLEQTAKLSEKYEVRMIGHFIDDVALARRKGLDIWYSGDSNDYPAFLKDCQLVISPRVHACGLASALGIPSICVQHDGRAETAAMFGSLVVKPGTDIQALVQKTDWEDRAAQIHRIKEGAWGQYVELLKDALSPGAAVS